jgi:DNA-binding HxlR family transcriptional regulator
LEEAMQLLGKRWTGLILYTLLSNHEPKRFSEISSLIPISGRLLTERLKELEEEGIVTRQVYPDVPVRVEYTLTEKGRAMGPIIQSVQAWASVWCGNTNS